jgi:hypothetical protein
MMLAYHGWQQNSTMKVTRHFANLFMRHRAQPLVCLVAAFLLQAPLVAGLVLASGACCTGDHCPVAAHHHPAAKTEAPPMDCGHDKDQGTSNVRSCSISCCNTTEQAAVHSNLFLLSPAVELASASPRPETVSGFAARETAAPSAPLSPPPESPDRFI